MRNFQVDVFKPSVTIDGREITPESQPQNEVEARVVEILRAMQENLLLTAIKSQAVAELLLWEKVKEVCDEN